jgi:hypothetical protein
MSSTYELAALYKVHIYIDLTIFGLWGVFSYKNSEKSCLTALYLTCLGLTARVLRFSQIIDSEIV